MLRDLSALALICALVGCDSAAQRDDATLREELAAQTARLDVLTERLDRVEQQLHAQKLVRDPPTPSELRRPMITPLPSPPAGPAVPFTARCEGGTCKVPRAAFESLMSRPDDLVKAARIIPSMRDGETVGFKVFAIRPGSPLAELGFKNGDTIREINGERLDSMERALAAHAALKGTSTVTIVGERQGGPLQVVVTLE